MKKIFFALFMCLNLVYASSLTKQQKEEIDYLQSEYKKYLNHSYSTIEKFVYTKMNSYIEAYLKEKNIEIKSVSDFIDLEIEFESKAFEEPLSKKYFTKEFEKEFQMNVLGTLSLTYDKYIDKRNFYRKCFPNNAYYAIDKDESKSEFYKKHVEKIKRAIYYNIFSKHLKK